MFLDYQIWAFLIMKRLTVLEEEIKHLKVNYYYFLKNNIE